MHEMKRIQATAENYQTVFDLERKVRYPLITFFEGERGYRINKEQLEAAARVLACPIKVNPPNWQHGRIIYAMLRNYLSHYAGERPLLIDIGTAKGFSALIMKWAANDAKVKCVIRSADVIDPEARVPRNTVADCDGIKTLYEILEPWPETKEIEFHQLGGATLMSQSGDRINFAFLDGKHKYDYVRVEAGILRIRQKQGDLILFDDVHIPGVAHAVEELRDYKKEFIAVNANRRYCIAERL